MDKKKHRRLRRWSWPGDRVREQCGRQQCQPAQCHAPSPRWDPTTSMLIPYEQFHPWVKSDLSNLYHPIFAGLFSTAIGQSGSPLAFWATHNRSVDLDSHMLRVGGMLGCSQDSLPELHRCMMELPWIRFAGLIRSTVSEEVVCRI